MENARESSAVRICSRIEAPKVTPRGGGAGYAEGVTFASSRASVTKCPEYHAIK